MSLLHTTKKGKPRSEDRETRSCSCSPLAYYRLKARDCRIRPVACHTCVAPHWPHDPRLFLHSEIRSAHWFRCNYMYSLFSGPHRTIFIARHSSCNDSEPSTTNEDTSKMATQQIRSRFPEPNADDPKFILEQIEDRTTVPNGSDHIDSTQGKEANPSGVP